MPEAGVGVVPIRPDLTGFSKALNAEVEKATDQAGKTASTRMRGIGRSLTSAGRSMSLGLTLPIAAGFKAVFDRASDLNEAVNVTGLVFKDARGEIDRFVKSASKIGFSEKQAREATAQIGGLLKVLGMTTDETVDWSQTLTTLSADIGSAFNAEPAEVVQALGAALRGETEPARRFNIMLDDASVRAKAVEMGLAATTAEVDKNGKAQATLALIMEQTRDVQGDFANTADGAANKQRIMRAEMENTAATIGNQLLPLGQQLLTWVKGLMDGFARLTPTQQKFVLGGLALLAVLGPLVTVLGALSTAIGILLSPIGLVVIAVVGFIALWVLAYQRLDWFRKAVDTWAGFLVAAFKTWLDYATFAWRTISSGLQTAWGIVRPILNIWKAIGTDTFEAVAHVVRFSWAIMEPIFSAIVGFVRERLIPVWSGIAEAVGAAFDRVPGIISAALRAAGNLISGFLNAAGGVADAIGLDHIASALRGAASSADRWGESRANPDDWSQGRVRAMATGGYLSPGVYGNRRADVIPARLMPGEYVVRRDAVAKYGVGFMDALNTGRLPGYGIGGIVKSIGGGLLDKLRGVAAGALERVWPELGVPGGLLGIPPGGHNYARRHIIDFIKGEASKRQAAEEAAARSTTGGLAGSTTGLNPEFLRRFLAYSNAVGGLRIISGFRSRAQQERLYAAYLAGRGNLAARPGTSNHERGLAIDHAPRSTAAMRQIAAGFRLHYPVPGEPWHVEPFAKGGLVGSFARGGIVPRDMVGRLHEKEMVLPKDVTQALLSGRGPMVGAMYVQEKEDVDEFFRRASFHAMAGGF